MADKSQQEPAPKVAPKVALGVGAHPDDLDFCIAGTMATWADQGADVYYLILTNGNKGCPDESADLQELTATRRREQRQAAQLLGVKEVFFYDYDDGFLQVTPELKCDIIRIIRKVKPDVVLTMDPSLLYFAELGFINHPDHRAAGQATLDAVYPLARDCLTYPELIKDEGLRPHKVTSIYLTNFDRQNYHVDITDVIDKKIAALGAHTSQMPGMVLTQKMARQIAAESGAKIGVEYAESFLRIDIQG